MNFQLCDQIDVEGGEHSAHLVGKSYAAAAGKQQSDRSPAVVPSPDDGTGVAARAEKRAARTPDGYLVAEKRDPPAAVINSYGGADVNNRAARQLRGASRFANRHIHLRSNGCVADSEKLPLPASQVNQFWTNPVRPAPPGGAVNIIDAAGKVNRNKTLQNGDLIRRTPAAVKRTGLADAVVECGVVRVGEDVIVAEDHPP